MKKALIGVALCVVAASQASAATIVFEAGNGGVAPSETLVYSFNDPANDPLVSGSGFAFLTGPQVNGAPPATGDGSRYLAVFGGGMATIDFAQANTGFSFDIGSVDDYNTLTVRFADGTSESFTGMDFVANADGNQSADRTNGRLRVFAGVGQTISGVTFASSANSFEVDQLAVAAVPEPATWAMMIGGFGLVGGAMRRRARGLTPTLA